MSTHSSVSPVKSVSEIDAVREQGILSSLAGFPILLVFGIAWIAWLVRAHARAV